MAHSQNGGDREVPWLPGEHFELVLDDHEGMSTSPKAGDNVLTLTTHRATKLGTETGKRTTSVVPLDRVAAVEVIDVERPKERLGQGLIVLAVGVVLGVLSHVMLNVNFVTIVAGGLPALVAIYILAGYAFPDSEGELVLHTGSFALRQPLRTAEARRDAYLVAHRIYALIDSSHSGTGSSGARPVELQPSPAPVVAPPESWRHGRGEGAGWSAGPGRPTAGEPGRQPEEETMRPGWAGGQGRAAAGEPGRHPEGETARLSWTAEPGRPAAGEPRPQPAGEAPRGGDRRQAAEHLAGPAEQWPASPEQAEQRYAGTRDEAGQHRASGWRPSGGAPYPASGEPSEAARRDEGAPGVEEVSEEAPQAADQEEGRERER